MPVRLGNGKEEMELEILEEIIQQNYIKIIEDVNAILKKIEDKLKEKSAVPAAGTHKTEQKSSDNIQQKNPTMRKIHSLLVAACLLAASCNREEIQPKQTKPVCITSP